jgi:hypothetical protein
MTPKNRHEQRSADMTPGAGPASGTPSRADQPPPMASAGAFWDAPGSALDSPAPPWVHGLVKLMDEAITIPGTKFRIGWDAIIGFFFPMVGDAASALSHVTLIYFAFRARVSKVVLARMVLNVAMDQLWGSVPIIGDLFDAGFRANRKNLELLERGKNSRRGRTKLGDLMVVWGAIGAVIGIVLLPLIVVALLGGAIIKLFTG